MHRLRALLPTTAILVCLFAAAPAAAEPEGLTLEQIAELNQVVDIAISPDGRHIAYALSVQRKLFEEDDGASWTELHVIDRDGDSRGYVTGEVNISRIGWTPDSRRITFLTRRGDDKHATLYAIPVDGGEAQKLHAEEEGIRDYSLSPDGERAAVISREPRSEREKRREELGFNQQVFEEDVRPFRVHVVPVGDHGGEQQTMDLEWSAQSVQWSPDGSRLAVAAAPHELVDNVIIRTRVHFIDWRSGETTAQVETPGKIGSFAWAPDGAHLGLIMAEDANDPSEGRLATVAVDATTPADLLPGLEGHVWHVGWRDARHLYYISYEGVNARLGEIRRDGSRDRTLLGGDGPVWDLLSVSDDGAVALGATAPDHPREVFRVAGNRRSTARLTDSNPWLADVALGRHEVVRYQARDGLEIEGILIHPLDEGDAPHPLILQVHGGPEAHYSNGWLTAHSMPGQAAAARGYAVFYPNYRASTGRGVEFSKLNHGRPAAEEFDDLVDGVDHLIEAGIVDGDRVGITGGSYGGYASAWGATYYTERFAAAVMNVGISEKISMLGTSDIPVELYQVHYLTWPWEDWDLYRDASPLYHAEQARTPILIAHGDADPRVHPTQSLQLYRYLKLIDRTPVRLVLYPGEGHGNARAASRYDYSLRLMRWMDHYLKGEGGDPPPHELDYGIPEEKEDE